MGPAKHKLLDEVEKAKVVQGPAHNFLDLKGERNAQGKLAFLHQPVSADIQERMAETQEEEHSILEVQEGETPLKQKAEKAVFDPEKVEMVVVPWVEHAGEVLEHLRRTVASKNAGKIRQQVGNWKEEEALRGH